MSSFLRAYSPSVGPAFWAVRAANTATYFVKTIFTSGIKDEVDFLASYILVLLSAFILIPDGVAIDTVRCWLITREGSIVFEA